MTTHEEHDSRPVSPERQKLVTRRPGGASWFLIAYGFLLLVLLSRFDPDGAEARALWDEGTPVVLQVIGQDQSGDVVLQEYGGRSRWTTAAADVPTTVPGGGIQARFVGPDRQVMFPPVDRTMPGWVRIVPLVIVAMGVPGLIGRSRWRGMSRVLSAPPRRVKLEPAWLRGSLGPRVAVRVREADGGSSGVDSDLVVEVKGTPVTWWALAVQGDSHEVLAYGPDASGLMVLETEAGRAVPSSSPRRGDRVKATVCPWSDRLATEIGLLAPPAQPLTVGGSDRQRVSVGGAGGSVALGHGPQQSYAMDMSVVKRRSGLYPAVISIAVLVVILVAGSSTLTPILYLSGLAAIGLMRWWGARAMTTRAPLSAWSDRRAASEAGHAVFAMGLRPATVAEAEQAGG